MTADSCRPPDDRGTDSAPSIDALDTAICRLARQLNSETYRLLLLVRDFDDRFGWAKWGCRNCAEWLAWRCQLSLSTAREKVRTAQALRMMPSISAAFAEGRLSYSKVRALTRVVEFHDEEQLLEYALEATAVQVEERCRQLRNGQPQSVGGAWRAWAHRSLMVRRDPVRGTMSISVEVPIEDGEVIARAIERAAQRGETAMGLEFASTSRPPEVREAATVPGSAGNGWLAQQADALVAVAKAYLSGGSEAVKSASVADHYQVVVHIDDSALRGGAGRSDLALETVKRMTCDGSLITVVEDDRGRPLQVSRKRRTVSNALRRALWSRDRSCTFPGCHNRRYVDGHHIHHWADGGETNLRNIALLCSHHHRLVHEGGFKLRRKRNGSTYFQRPDGRVIPRCGYRLEDRFVEAEPSAEAHQIAAVY